MAKKRTAARKQVRRKLAHRRRASPNATINTVVILVAIVMVLGGLILYAQNEKQAALWPSLMQAIATLPAPAPTSLPSTAQPGL
jgi:Ni,Fe-hydrogenase I cytochrome b subunit